MASDSTVKRTKLRMPSALAALIVAAAAAKECRPLDPTCCQPNLCPGWEWRTHGGLPPLPWGPNWGMRNSTIIYFVGSPMGLENQIELAAGSQVAYHGIGWEQNNIPANYTHLEEAEIAVAQALKALRPHIKVGVTRNSVVATTFWDTAKEHMLSPASNDFWLQCDGKPCTATWGLDEPCKYSPASRCNPTSYMFNFSNPDFQDWYIYKYIGEAANNSLFDGIYFDAGVDVSVASGLNITQYYIDSQRVFDRAYALIRAKGKWVSSWAGYGTQLEITNETCASTMSTWLAAGASEGHTFQAFSMAFNKVERHRPGSCGHAKEGQDHQVAEPSWPHSPRDQNATVAAFMIARGPSAYLELSVYGAYFCASDLTFPPILETDYGAPTGAGRVSGTVYSREYEGGTVSLDCATWTSTFTPN